MKISVPSHARLFSLILSQNRIFERKNNCSKFDGSESYRYMVSIFGGRHEASRARVYVSIARKQIRLRRHPVHPTRCTLRHTRFRRVSRYDEVVLLPLGRLNKAIGAGRPPNPPPYVRSVRKRKLQLRVNGGNTKPRFVPSFIPRVFNEACDR